MGLDHYVYRMKKIGKETLKQLNGKHADEFDWHKYLVLDAEYVETERGMYEDLKGVLQPITVIKTFVDIPRIEKELEIPNTAGIIMTSHQGNTTTYIWNTPDHKSFTLNEQNEKEYTYNEEVPSYICYCTEVHYMRKEYEIQDAMYELYDGDIQNCGYYHMSEDMLDKINELSGRKVVDSSATNLFYHEWY